MIEENCLALSDIHGWYGESKALHGIEINVKRGQTVALMGRNGAGKTTTLRAITRQLTRTEGSITKDGQDISAVPRHKLAYKGIGFVPEDRGTYNSLSVQENLKLLPKVGNSGMSIDELHSFFPNIQERRHAPAGTLSGGEQQMLAMARVLLAGPDLILLDEPTEGLAPVFVQKIAELLQDLKKRGLTILLVEQNMLFTRKLADHFYMIENGLVVADFPAEELSENEELISRVLGV
ncbi:ABC transporter ATP-binding protein [Epibacterium ulvae]|uniref:ABC transporter ATP-binding protein n=1 Tax=Epibacterium ulvae TaxID=1156985 RepID=UPI001BFC3771|nr:ABC transporter ATP-binding protein [Epibacterium ulvae]MBT8155599.1 ABC transporter ATP-binding protein [Epibacterium ulvae]